MSRADVADFFSDAAVLTDPLSYYESVRQHGSVWQEPYQGSFLVTGYDEIVAVHRDRDTYSSCNAFSGPFPGLPEKPVGDDASALIEKYRDVFPSHQSLVTFDGPLHADHRGLMMRLLTPRRLLENEEYMWRLGDELIDGFIDKGSCDFIAEYAQPFSLLVIADLLGVPESDRDELRRVRSSKGQVGAVGGRPSGYHLDTLDEFFSVYIQERRQNPTDDVLGKLAVAKFADRSTPELIDVVRAGTFLFAGGQSTAAQFIGNAIKLIAEDETVQQQLHADRSRIPAFLEETLRLHSPVKTSFRMARRTTLLGGVEIPAGSTLVLLMTAANRDGTRFDCPAEFHADRANLREHITFGRGVHSCPGAPLARAEGRITLERMFDRFAHIDISRIEHGPPDARHYDFVPSYISQGLQGLHLDLNPK